MRDWYLALGPVELFGYAVGASIVLQAIIEKVVLRLARKTKTELDETIISSVRMYRVICSRMWARALALRSTMGSCSVWR